MQQTKTKNKLRNSNWVFMLARNFNSGYWLSLFCCFGFLLWWYYLWSYCCYPQLDNHQLNYFTTELQEVCTSHSGSCISSLSWIFSFSARGNCSIDYSTAGQFNSGLTTHDCNTLIYSDLTIQNFKWVATITPGLYLPITVVHT